jgi:adenine nucleotide transporter 17
VIFAICKKFFSVITNCCSDSSFRLYIIIFAMYILTVTLPIDCVTTAIQTDDKNRGAFVLLGTILSEKGIGGFYKGIQAYTVLCLKPAIQYTVYEQVKKIVLAARRVNSQSRQLVDESLSAAEAFFLGMFARIVATMLTYPYLRAKVMLQSTYGDAKVKPTIPQMIAEQLSSGGVWGLYQGIGPELTRGVFSAALMMMVKERIGVVVRALIDGQEREKQQQQQH